MVMKWKFHHHKNLILLEYVDAGSVLISTMDSSGKKKNFIGFKENDASNASKNECLCKNYDDKTKGMNFLIKYDLLKKYNGICNKVNNSITKELDCKPVYNKHFLKT